MVAVVEKRALGQHRPRASLAWLIASAAVALLGLFYLLDRAAPPPRPVRGSTSRGRRRGQTGDETAESNQPPTNKTAMGEGTKVAAAEMAAAEPAAEPVAPAARRPLRALLGWAIYLAIIAGAILIGPRVMAWVLDSQHPIAVVSGDSMWPALRKGDVVFLRGVSSVDELKVGDIIGFRHANGLAIHRVVRIYDGQIITKGDANFQDDPPISIEDVIGKVPTIAGQTVKIPLLGHASFLLGPLTKQTNDVPSLPGENASADDSEPSTYGPNERSSNLEQGPWAPAREAEPSTSPRQAALGQPPVPAEPTQTVFAFYRLVNDGHFAEAYELLTPGLQTDDDFAPFDEWLQGYEHTSSINLIAATIQELDEERALVQVEVESVDRGLSEGDVKQRFAGTWSLQLSNDQWLLDEPQLALVESSASE